MKSIIAALVIFFLPILTEATIIETATIDPILQVIDEDTWVVVDLDNTTFEGKQALGHTEWFYDKAFALIREGMTLDEATRECYPEWIEIQKVCPVKPLEEAFIPSLIALQKRGIVVMALTHRQPSLVEATLRQLNSLNLDFYLSAPAKHTFSVPSETPTLYKQGVLFTGEFNKKGEIFVCFLSIIKQKPKKVVFIDDKRSHVEEVTLALSKQGIECIGFHYTATQHVKKVYDPEVAEFQRKFLKTIMSNEAARLLMNHGID
jgi:hypothetical protein